MASQTITSHKLLGIIRLDEYHRGYAPMRSTGQMRQAFDDAQDPRSWSIEFLCDVCHQEVYENRNEDLDLIREVLMDNGIIKDEAPGGGGGGAATT
jgi:hypothetical protein